MNAIRIMDNGDVFLKGVDCHLKCEHCANGVAKRLRESSLWYKILTSIRNVVDSVSSRREDLLREFEAKIAKLPVDEGDSISLSGHDVLEYQRLFDLMTILKKHGRKARIISPGLRLSDREFASRLAAYRPGITITYLTRRPELYRELTDHPEAKPRIEQAMINLRDLGMEYSVNFVATSKNFRDLTEVAGFLFDEIGLGGFTLLTFAPARIHFFLDRGASGRFVRYDRLNGEIARFAERFAGTNKMLCLWRVPPCKLEPEVLSSENVTFSVCDYREPSCPTYRHPNCSGCRFENKCFFVSLFYHKVYPDEAFDHERVNRVFDRLRY